MARRYSDIKRAAKLQTALTNYINYLQTMGTRPSKIGQYGARDLNKIVYVQPFTAQVAADEYLMSRTTDESWTTVSPAILGGTTKANVLDTIGVNNIIDLPRFSAARVVFFTNATRSVVVETSDVTGLQYLKYNGTRYSCPFGATADTDDQMEAFAEIKAYLLTNFSTNAIRRVSLSREYVGIEAA